MTRLGLLGTFTGVAALAWLVGAGSATVDAQNRPAPGRIEGTVTADRGDVRALRVKATDTVNKISYTVFTSKGRYRIPDLPREQLFGGPRRGRVPGSGADRDARRRRQPDGEPRRDLQTGRRAGRGRGRGRRAVQLRRDPACPPTAPSSSCSISTSCIRRARPATSWSRSASPATARPAGIAAARAARRSGGARSAHVRRRRRGSPA